MQPNASVVPARDAIQNKSECWEHPEKLRECSLVDLVAIDEW
jgi:hypothetical protein